MDFRVLNRLSNLACNFRLCEEVGVVCEQHPCGGELAAIFIGKGRYSAGVHAGGFGKQSNFGFKIDVLIGDMECEDAARSEVALVDGNGLRGEQMQGNGVA